MVFKKKESAAEQIQEEIAENAEKVAAESEQEVAEEVEETPVEEATEEVESEAQPEVVQVPIFLTEADTNRMLFENNLMLKDITKFIEQEVTEEKA